MQKQEMQIPELGAFFSQDHSNPKDYQKFERCAAFGNRLFAEVAAFFFPRIFDDLTMERESIIKLDEEIPGSSNSLKAKYLDPITEVVIANLESSYIFWDKRDGTSWFVRIRIFEEEKSIFEFEFYDQQTARIRFSPEILSKKDAITTKILDFFSAHFAIFVE